MTKNSIAFTGGGWNAMSGHSGWIGSALASGEHIQGSPLSLDQLFEDTQSAAGNSGGSWFLSMLAYSEGFAHDLNYNSRSWFDTGYFGEQKRIFMTAAESTNWGALLNSSIDRASQLTVSDIIDTLEKTYANSNPFLSGINSIITGLKKLEIPGVNDLITSIERAGYNLAKTFANDVITSLGLQEKLKEFAIESFESSLGKNLADSISALVINPSQNGSSLLNWYQSVQDTTFKAYNASETLNQLSQDAKRLSWAGNKNLFFPLTASGFPIAIDKSTGGSFLQSTLTPSSTSSLPTNSPYLIPLTAKIFPESNNSQSTIEFPEKTLDFSSYVYPEIAGLSNPVQTKRLDFPLTSNLTILDMVSASGSFAGEMATDEAIKTIISDIIQNKLFATIDNFKANADQVIQSYPKKIINSFKSSGDQFFESLLRPTDNFWTYVTDQAWNLLIKTYEASFDLLLDLGSDAASLFSGVVQSTFDSIVQMIENGLTDITNFSDYLYQALAEEVKGLALPVNLADGKAVRMEENALPVDFNTSVPNRIFDGGLTDNTGVLASVQHWQSERPDEEFVINAFINSTDVINLGEAGNVAIDLAKLFGKDGTRASDSIIQEFPLSLDGGGAEEIPSIPAVYPLVFESGDWDSPTYAPVWDYEISDDFGIAYYQIDVTTVDNPAWGIEAGSNGILNAFTTYNKNSFAGPVDVNGKDIWLEYEKNYDLITDGIINHGGYEHLLKALGVLEFEVDQNNGAINFKGNNGYHSDYTLQVASLPLTLTNQHFSCDLYSYTDSTKKSFLGTVGAGQAENGFDFTDAYDLLRFEQGSSISFELRKGGSNEPIATEVLIETGDEAYTISLVDAITGEISMVLNAGFSTSLDVVDAASRLDTTLRTNSADSYLNLDAGSQWTVKVTASGAYTNQFSILKVEIDPVSGSLMIDGHLEDTEEFDKAARAAFASDSIFEHTVLNPFTVTSWTFTPQEAGHYAPALLTEEGNLFLGEHDLIGKHSHTRMLGEMQFGFEDTATQNGSDWDMNDAIIQFIPQTTSI